MVPKTKLQYGLGIAVIISAVWLYYTQDFEPLLALVMSIVTYGGSFTMDSTTVDRHDKPVIQGVGPCPLSLIRSASIADRPRIIEKAYHRFPQLEGAKISEVLALLSIVDRPAALPLLLLRLANPLTEQEVIKILGQMSIVDRPTAAVQISHATPSGQREP